MPKRTDIKKVMVIGSGPIVIGQAAEFDYAGTQACLALKEEGYEVILVNSNPATIMTDTFIADKVYMEPLKLEYVAKIIRYERPDAIVPGLGGQTGLNLAVQLAKKGILEECGVEILGTSFESIEQAEDRELFKQLCIDLGEPVLPSEVVNSIEEAVEVLHTELSDRELKVRIDRSPVIDYMHTLGKEPSEYYIEETRTLYAAMAEEAGLGFSLDKYDEETGEAEYRFFLK